METRNRPGVVVVVAIVVVGLICAGLFVALILQLWSQPDNSIPQPARLPSDISARIAEGFNDTEGWSELSEEQRLAYAMGVGMLSLGGNGKFYTHPDFPERHYFITYVGGTASIWLYDSSQDQVYKTTPEPSVAVDSVMTTSVKLVSEELASDQTWDVLGFREDELVFRQIGLNYRDPIRDGCGNEWLYSPLNSVKLEAKNPRIQSFTLPAGERADLEQGVSDCVSRHSEL